VFPLQNYPIGSVAQWLKLPGRERALVEAVPRAKPEFTAESVQRRCNAPSPKG
jgi:hypothetical protein